MFYAYCWHTYNDFVNRFLFHLHFRPLTTVALANTEHYDRKKQSFSCLWRPFSVQIIYMGIASFAPATALEAGKTHL